MIGVLCAALTLATETNPFVTKVSSIEHAAESEFAAIKKAIGKSRIVLLGELTHGDGSSFEWKVSLVKYLHQRAGFDVLVWESGLFDCSVMDDALGTEAPARESARLGVFGHWATAEESVPIFDYAATSRRSKSPLHMAGFDLQGSGRAYDEQFPTFVKWLDTAKVLPATLKSEVEGSLALVVQNPGLATSWAKLRATTKPMLKIVEDKEPELTKAWGERAYSFRRQCFKVAVDYSEMMRLFDEAQAKQDQSFMVKSYNLRERSNAETIIWLAREHYKGRKLVVWAHNAHIVGVWPGQAPPAGENLTEFDSMGRLLKEKLGDRVFSAGVMAHSGKWSWMGNPTIDFAPAAHDSMESYLHGLGHEYAFVNLRGARTKPDNPLAKPMLGIVSQQQPSPKMRKWTDAYDSVLFIDTMKPRTQLAP